MNRKLVGHLGKLLLLVLAFQACGRVGIFDTTESSLDAQSIDFDNIIVEVDVNKAKTIDILNTENFGGTVSLDDKGTVLNKSFDNQASIQLASAGSANITFTPVFGFRGEIDVPVYVKYSNGRTKVITVAFKVQNPLRDFKPALAVRAANCMLCHANVKGDMVSDLGYKSAVDPFGADMFFRRNALDGNNSTAYTSAHAVGESGWTTSKFTGNIILPKVNLDQLPALPNGDQRQYIIPRNYTEGGIAKVAATLSEYFDKVLFADRSRLKSVKEKSVVYIGAPTADEIRGYGRLSAGQPVSFVKSESDAPNLSGFGLANGKQYYTNTGEMICEGDLFVDGVVLLNNLYLNTKNGCRIHATRTVFVQGAIEFVEEQALSNIQIMSARSIQLGTGMCYDCDAHDGQVHYNENFMLTRANNTYYWANQLRNQADLSGYVATMQQDFLVASAMPANIPRPPAGVDPKSYYQQQFASLGVTLLDANNPFDNKSATQFRRILLNAPDVQSRYGAKFEGIVIAEFALWKLGVFDFKFDSVFTAVPVFPLVDLDKVIQVKD